MLNSYDLFNDAKYPNKKDAMAKLPGPTQTICTTRPEPWTKFKTTDQYNASQSVGEYNMLLMRRQSQARNRHHRQMERRQHGER